MRHGVFLKIVASIALVLVMGFCSRGAWAQDGAPIVKKAPPRMAGGGDAPADSGGDSAMPAQKAGPRTASNATAEQMKPPADEVIDSFKKAYRKAGRPKLLILVGLARDPLHDPGQGGIVGGKAQGVGVGEDLSFTDTTGITELLENGIGEILNDDGTIKLVDRAALVEKDRRDAESLAQNDADEAIDAMARKVNADLVLFIKFRPTTLANAGQTNYAFSCISELKDINTAQKLPLTPFNWDGELNNERARVYSAVLSNLICQRYAKWQAATGGLRDMSVKIISFADSQAPAKVRRLLKKMDGVDGDVDMSTETTTDGGTNATYEFQFDGNGADLQDAITDAAKGAGLPLAVLDQKKNSIIFRVGGDGATAQAPDWWLISDANP
ncbi:MAG TPA: hypothetical protein VHS31_00755, partial [Tepidisphaeraceae bacterium]|nr:hypothetical protein [Tepidisphaeraceae bacterium]